MGVVCGVDEPGDQQDRADREEDVLTEEEPDVVGAGGEGTHLLAGLVVQRPVLPLGGALGHGGREGAHRLGVAEDALEAEGRGDLPQQQIEGEEAAGGEPREAGDQPAGLLLEPVPLQEADDRERDREDRHGSAGGEAVAEGGDDLLRREAAEQSGGYARHSDDQQGVAFRGETDDHHEDAKENDHAPRLPRSRTSPGA